MKFTSMLSVLFFFNLAVSVSVAVAEVATTGVQISGNLDSESDINDLPSSFVDYTAISDSSAFQAPVWVSDSSGRAHEILFTFFHTSPSTWAVVVFVDGGEISKGAGNPIEVASAPFLIPLSGNPVSFELVAKIPWAGAKKGNIVLGLEFTSFDNKSLVRQIDVKPGTCSTMESLVNSSIESISTTYNLEKSSCSAKLDAFVVTSKELADRAIESLNCETKKFGSTKECERCFNLAIKPLKQKFDKELFHGLLAKAVLNISRRKETACLSAYALSK